MTADRRRAAFLGLGRMGRPMAARLLDAGWSLAVWNRTPGRDADLVARGARSAASPADAVRDAQVVVLMLADPPALDAVLVGREGALGSLERGALVIDCSTVGPDDSRNLAHRCAERGVRFVDAPVLGSTPAAAGGTLTVLAGGDADAVDAAEPVLRHFGQRIVRAGPTGSGSALKLAMNLLVGGLTELLAESIVLAQRSGVKTEVFRETLFTSVLDSPFLRYKAPQLLERQFAPLFTTALMLKDLELALALGRSAGLSLGGLEAVRDAYAASAADGRGDVDFSAVIDTIAGQGAGQGTS